MLPTLTTPRLTLMVAAPALAPAMLRFVTANQAHLAPWEPLRSPEYWTLPHWEAELARAVRQFEGGSAVRWLLVQPNEQGVPAVIGACNFRNIVHGAFQACHLGYSLAQAAQGQGLMREALTAALDDVFTTRGLHRVMANYVPTNARSGGLLRRLGFTVEGYARDYLFLAGRWQDHILTALTAEQWAAQQRLIHE